ncbi:hypothetical protein D3C77_409330 [compost metagenome]
MIISQPSGSVIMSFALGRNDSLIVVVGSVYLDSPTLTFMPSIIASVSGIFIVIVVPSCSTLSTETVPPMDSIFFVTTSIPTPRPLNSVI